MKTIDISIDISDPGPCITWYNIETKVCGIAHH